jgi:hypothetical protein
VPAGLLLLGRACRRRRPEVWARTRDALRFLALVGGPLFLFHLFYPHYSARFLLLPHCVALLLGAIWAVALPARVPAPAWALAAAAAAPLAFALRPPDPVGPDWYKRPLLLRADRLLPADACLVSAFNAMYVEEIWVRDSERCHLPLDDHTDYVRWWVGPHGRPREQILPYTAADQPERVAALLASGRRVFVEMLQPMWSQRLPVRDGLLAGFDVAPVLYLRHRELVTDPDGAHFTALVELLRRRPPSKPPADPLD